MVKTVVQEIRDAIEKSLERRQKIIIYPYGDIGMQVKRILNEAYGINEAYILDNHLCRYNPDIHPCSFLAAMDTEDYTVILACLNEEVFDAVEQEILQYISKGRIIVFESIMKEKEEKAHVCEGGGRGKYTYGSLCHHPYVKSIGAFSSIAAGCDVVENHAIEYITTSPMVYLGEQNDPLHEEYREYEKEAWYFEGVTPKGKIHKARKITIGNDVWLGRNTIVTNGANIGNGVIAGAGSIITKDVPDYAVVAGVPARIIRYRYTKEQIEELNRIAWWDWPDEVIRERFDDFYLPVEEFIEKYRNRDKSER